MSTSGPNSPSSGVNTDRGADYPAWSDPGNVTSSNDARATASLTAGTPSAGSTTDFEDVTGFGFAISAGDTINGVQVEVEKRRVSGDSRLRDDTVQLIKGGTAQGNNKADGSTNWPSGDTYVSYGGAADLWGLALTAGDVNASNFGVRIAAKSVWGTTSPGIDHVRITVTHTAGGGGGQATRTVQQQRLRRV